MSRDARPYAFTFYFPDSSLLRITLEQSLRDILQHGRAIHPGYHVEAIEHFFFPRRRLRFSSQSASKIGEVVVRPADNYCLTAKRLVRQDAPGEQRVVFCQERGLHRQADFPCQRCERLARPVAAAIPGHAGGKQGGDRSITGQRERRLRQERNQSARPLFTAARQMHGGVVIRFLAVAQQDNLRGLAKGAESTEKQNGQHGLHR
jgi:hypothetical protein